MTVEPLPITSSSALWSGRTELADIAWAHHAIEATFGTRFTCLMLALSARAMLRRRSLSSTLVLGVKRAAPQLKSRLGAHAWVLSEGWEIVGGNTRDGHVPVAAFGDYSAAKPNPIEVVAR